MRLPSVDICSNPVAASVVSISRLTLTAKLAAINLLLVVSLVAVAVVAWRMLPDEEHGGSSVAQLGRAQRANQNADMLHDALHAGVLAALLVNQVPGLEPDAQLAVLTQDARDFRAELRALDAMPLPASVAGPLSAAREAGQDYVTQSERLARLALSDRNQVLAAMPEFQRVFDSAKQALARLTEVLAVELDAAHQRAHDATARARVVLVMAALVAVVVAVACVGWIARSIRRSLAELRDVARDVAGGNLDRRSANPGDDEVGQLAGSINRMAATLQQMIGRVREEAERGSFRAELAQALDMADSEPQACEAAARAMAQISSTHPMELLVADSSDAHLGRAAEHPLAGAPGCGVEAPYGCVAVRSGHAMRFSHSDALNACPRLRGRPQGAVSAVCVPVTFMGRALGVLHASAPADEPIGDAQFDRMTALGVQFGGRIGTVRAFERTQLQAATDALTGLANRRTVEKRLRELAQGGEPHVLVMVDLDHFKRLNDTHGHPAGDEALRVFAEVARGSTRETDLPGRWGGEEFAFVLPGMDEQEAAAWTERVRERLLQTVQQRGTPVFTASFGIAGSALADTPDVLVRLADEALYRAKREGRDRSATAVPGETVVPLRRESEHRAAVDVRLLADGR